MAWAALNNTISFEIIALYISAIFWTLGYDTIYGAQDMSDDEIIGLKSTSIKFKKKMKLFVSISYFITSMVIVYLFKNNIGFNIFSILLFFFISSLIIQLFKFSKHQPETCLNTFKLNNYSGLLLFLSIFLIDL